MKSRKVAIVTGAARGIGRTTTDLFLADGWSVVMVDRLEALLDAEASKLTHVSAITADVSNPQDAGRIMTEAIRSFGRIDCLVNNAGVADFGPLEEHDFTRWRRVMETNLDGVFLCAQASIPYLKETRGSIVNIGSISGLRASTLRVAYGTSKAAVIHLTKQQAAELGEYGVRVNCVAPGPVATAMSKQVHTQDIIDAYHDAIPLNRYGTEREIAEAIVFLASDKASYITGQILAADGGFDAVGVGLPSLRNP
jgi:meso-butanediol dehydrogenase/(S,S)-butanediol dehydrogenase/diacetyl reductase